MTSVPVFAAADVERAVSPVAAVDAVRAGFVAHARGEWSMQPKLYVTNYPAGDFRAMPALGGGHALLKWVTSFPGNPAQGLPTVSGLVLLSDASNGTLEVGCKSFGHWRVERLVRACASCQSVDVTAARAHARSFPLSYSLLSLT